MSGGLNLVRDPTERFVITRADDGLWYWFLITEETTSVAVSPNGFENRYSAILAAQDVRERAARASCPSGLSAP